jgi:tetratricopeptide (TPR) repeat protein
MLQGGAMADENPNVTLCSSSRPGDWRALVSGAVALSLLALLGSVLITGCGHDRADREYLTALDGEEKGMTREEQIAHIDRAIRLAPGRAYYYDTRAGYWIDLKQFDRARQDLDRSIALLPRPYTYFMRGLATCQAGEVAESLADFDTAIAQQPENAQFYRGRALARAETGNLAGALEDAERLIGALPQQAESYHARGVALASLGRDAEAIADFDRAAGIRPDLVYVIEARARSRERLGDSARAEADRELAARLRVDKEGWAACLDPYRY